MAFGFLLISLIGAKGARTSSYAYALHLPISQLVAYYFSEAIF
ncbi:hypothetical protein [Arachidicoccus soli]|nr:hypothetical protein [Arachidicoccus soli]